MVDSADAVDSEDVAAVDSMVQGPSDEMIATVDPGAEPASTPGGGGAAGVLRRAAAFFAARCQETLSALEGGDLRDGRVSKHAHLPGRFPVRPVPPERPPGRRPSAGGRGCGLGLPRARSRAESAQGGFQPELCALLRFSRLKRAGVIEARTFCKTYPDGTVALADLADRLP